MGDATVTRPTRPAAQPAPGGPPGPPASWAILAGLFLRALWEFLVLAGTCIVLLLCCLGVGILLVPGVLDLIGSDARAQRSIARRRSGVEVTGGYDDVAREPGVWRLRESLRRLQDETVRRDLLWHVVNPVVGGALGLLPAAMTLHGLWGLFLLVTQESSRGWLGGGSWYAAVPLDWTYGHLAAGVWGAVELVLSFLIARPVLRLHGRWVRVVLGRSSEPILRARIQQLTRTRSEALDLQQDEISRIERDLHDGVQAHLVAMGMTLNEAAALMREDPERAEQMLTRARATSATALRELRGLVRGIRPPLLADRGLNEAVRSLCRSTGADVEFNTGLTARLPEALETALYFAVAELVTNAVKHAHAGRIEVTLAQGATFVSAEVRDDGLGGLLPPAADSRGGLAGIERRLRAFDGTLTVVSPVGGPTSVRAVVPVEVAAPVR